MRPIAKPRVPLFSSGPCAKRPGWSISGLDQALLGRSHRSPPSRVKLRTLIEKTSKILGLPEEWRLGVVPGSDTGAFEMAMWSILGARGVDVLVWESFGAAWAADIKEELNLPDLRIFKADYGSIPDLQSIDFSHDVVFVWNGTTSGVKVPDGLWIPFDRQGLTLCDATSAVFAQELPWEKLDVVTFSWQKVLGGEAGHGMIALGPRAVERLENFSPRWPIPKVFRLTRNGKINEGLFEGETINTPSMLCVEDALDALNWIEGIGGLSVVKEICDNNLELITNWVEQSCWIEFLASDITTRSNTSVCLKIIDPWFLEINERDQYEVARGIALLLEKEGIAFDINGYRDAPPGLRVWCGATINSDDIDALLPWLDWSYETVKFTFK